VGGRGIRFVETSAREHLFGHACASYVLTYIRAPWEKMLRWLLHIL
jgi:hypothetical protein